MLTCENKDSAKEEAWPSLECFGTDFLFGPGSGLVEKPCPGWHPMAPTPRGLLQSPRHGWGVLTVSKISCTRLRDTGSFSKAPKRAGEQAHRLLWGGRALKDHLIPTPCLSPAHPKPTQPDLGHCQAWGGAPPALWGTLCKISSINPTQIPAILVQSPHPGPNPAPQNRDPPQLPCSFPFWGPHTPRGSCLGPRGALWGRGGAL